MLQTPREADVKRFVTPLSYRMKRNKENSEDKESQSGIEGEAASENDEVLTCSKSAARMITPLELCRQSDAQRRASAKPKVAKPWQRQSSVANRQGAKVAAPQKVPEARNEKVDKSVASTPTDSPAKAGRPSAKGVPPTGRKMRATVVPPPSAPLVPVTVPDLAATVTSPRGAFTVAVPIGSARSSSPTLQCPQRAATDWSVTVPVASLTTPPTATVVTDKASSVLQRGVSHLPRRTFTQSCSVPSLLSPSPEPVPSLAQIVIQQLNTPSRQARNSIACPLTARLPTRPANVQTAPRPAVSTPSTPRPANLADFKPLLTELFDDKIDKEAEQSAQQLQHKIDQLQKLQQILQMQQEGLKQQQKAQSYQPKASKITRMEPPARGYSAASPRGPEVPFSTSPRARSSQAGRRRFMV